MHNYNFRKQSASSKSYEINCLEDRSPLKKLRKSIINFYSPELLNIINNNKSVLKNQQYESIDFIPFIQERDGCGRIISNSTRSSSLQNFHSNNNNNNGSVKKIHMNKLNSPQPQGDLLKLIPQTRVVRPNTTQIDPENKSLQFYQPKKLESCELNFEKFKANIPFHSVLNNNDNEQMKEIKISQSQKKIQNSTHTACFKSKQRDPIYSSNIKYPAIGQYNICGQSTYPRITRNIFMPLTGFQQIKPSGPDSLDYVNLLEIYKKHHQIDKISNDFSKQMHRDLFATMLNQKRKQLKNEDDKILQMDPEAIKRDFKHQSQLEEITYQKFKSYYIFGYIFCFKKYSLRLQ